MDKDLNKLMTDLQAAFPLMWIKDGAEFDNRHAGSLWTGEGSEIKVGDYKLPAFECYPTPGSYTHYTMGVLSVLHQFLEERGYFCEFYDGGTVFIYEI